MKMMFKSLAFLVCVSLVGISCLKSDSNSCPYRQSTINISQSEQARMDAYIDSNHIDAVKDRSGFYYHIINPGVGTDSITLCSQIQVSYKGQLMNDSTFDQRSNVVFTLGALIEAWRRGLPKVKKGGVLKLYVPPTLGYGSSDIKDSTGRVVIPKNSIIKFDITLTDYTVGN